jgi:Cof subfamily protein (haloacid dehalogenase superfamily)
MAKKLTDFKALLFDIDNTLTNTDRVVTPRTKAVLKQLAAKNLHIAICSGRNYSVLKEQMLPLFPAESMHITSGGGQLIKSTGEVIWEKIIPPEVCKKVSQRAKELHMGFCHSVEGYVYCNQYTMERYKEKEHLHSVLRPIEEVPKWGSPVLVLTETDQEMYTFLDHIPEISYKTGISSIQTPYADINTRGITKAIGIMEWSKLTGIDPTEIIGFGDGENDLEFLQLVGHSVAMGNAHPELKQNANRVIGHTDEDGLAIYLENVLKGNDV